MTLPESLKDAGYTTHLIGKWHLGNSRWADTPMGRGFHSHYGFFQDEEDSYTKTVVGGFDFWDGMTPQYDSGALFSLTHYNTRARELVNSHPAEIPLFLMFSPQSVHAPIAELDDPQYEARCTSDSALRRTYCATMSYLDDSLGDLVHVMELVAETKVEINIEAATNYSNAQSLI